MGDSTFVKYLLCARLNWNPFSKEVKAIPDIYWTLQYHMQDMIDHNHWAGFMEPQAELMGMISNPKVYAEYIKHKEAKAKSATSSYEIKSGKGTSGYAESNVVYDPKKGLVDSYGNVVLSREMLSKTNSDLSQGIMVSK